MASAQSVSVCASAETGQLVIRAEFGCGNMPAIGPVLTNDPNPSDMQIGLLMAAAYGNLLPPHPVCVGAPRGITVEIHEEQRNHRKSNGLVWIVLSDDLGGFLEERWTRFVHDLSDLLGESCRVINEGVGGGMHFPSSLRTRTAV